MTQFDYIYEKVEPILRDTYGDNSLTSLLVADLVSRIGLSEFGRRTREEYVTIRCWDFFSGGDTAQAAAAQIEDALDSDPRVV